MDVRFKKSSWGLVRLAVGVGLAALNVLTPIAPALQASADIIATPAITAGHEYTCALSDQGRVWCWGYNAYGSLGNGSNTNSNVPVAVTGLTDAVAITSGVLHTCALRATGSVMCWGRNDYGQLGIGNNTNTNVPTEVLNISGASAIGAGGNHACAIVTGGAVSCWGYNTYGQLGNNTTTSANVPVSVTGLTGATAIEGGLRHSCAIVTGGAVRCWGYNNHGELGDGSNANSSVPVSVTGLTGISALGMSDQFFSCATGGGTVSCWGDNPIGQLGNGTFVNSSIPVPVSNLQTATLVGSGGYHACAVLASESVQCWGENLNGQLGNGTSGNGSESNLPVPVSNLTNVIAVGSGLFHTCAIIRNGSLRCWGRNNYGQLGDGTTTDSNVPIGVLSLVLVTPSAPTPPITPFWRVTLDPNGGTCFDGPTRSDQWTTGFIGYRYLPGASDCTRTGYTFAGWANTSTPTNIRALPLLIDPSDGAQRYFVAENLDLVAVWNPTSTATPTPTPAPTLKPTVFFGVRGWLCRDCGVLLFWSTPTTETPVSVTSPTRATVCTNSTLAVGEWTMCDVKTGRAGTYTLTINSTTLTAAVR